MKISAESVLSAAGLILGGVIASQRDDDVRLALGQAHGLLTAARRLLRGEEPQLLLDYEAELAKFLDESQ